MKFFNAKFKWSVGALVVTFFGFMPAVKADLVLEQQKVAPSAVDNTGAAVEVEEEAAPAAVSAPTAKKAPLVIEQKTSPTIIVQDDQNIVAPVSGTVIPVGEPRERSGTAAILQKMEDNNKNVLKQMELKRIEQEDRFGKSVEGAISGVGVAPTGSVAGPASQADALVAPAAAPVAQPAPAAVQPTVVTVPVKDEFVGSMKNREELEIDDDGEVEYERESMSSRSRSSARLKDLVDEEETPKSEKTLITVRGGGGLPTMVVDDNYSVNGRYAANVGIGALIGDHLGVEASYTYSVYGIALSSYNPYAMAYGNPYATNTNYENYALKQNVFDVNLKVYLVDRTGVLRPYVGGGVGYSKGFINYDQALINQQRNMGIASGPDYEISSYLGTVGGGLDLSISKNLSVGGQFKYYTVFSSYENQPLNNAALAYGPNYGAAYGNGAFEKQALGGSLAQSGFYTILLNAALTF